MEALTHIVCQSCGADVELTPGLLTATCQYCGSAVSLLKPTAEAELKIEFIVPAAVSQAELRAMAHTLMVKPETVPDDILDASQVEEETFVYVPCFLGEGTFVSRWSASFGFDRQEAYTEYENYTDSRGNSRSRPVTRYRTVTDWRPASGTASGSFRRVCCAAGSDQLPPKAVALVEGRIPSQGAVPYDQVLMTGYAPLDFNQDAKGATSYILGLVAKQDAIQAARQHAKGDRQRDWAADADVTFSTPVKAGFLPLGRFVFSYGGSEYKILAEGVALGAHLADPMPVDAGRQKMKTRGYLPLLFVAMVFGLACLGVYGNLLDFSDTLIPLAASGIIALLFGMLRSRSISSFSRLKRGASLAAKKLEITDGSNPLPEVERAKLLADSQPPVRPFLARTESDRLKFLVVTVVSVIVMAFGFDFRNFTRSLSRPPSRSAGVSSPPAAPSVPSSPSSSASSSPSSSASSSRSSSASSSRSSSASSSPSSSASSSPSSQADGGGAGTSTGGGSSGSPAVPAVISGRAVYDLADLRCGGSPVVCRTPAGRPADGLVYEPRRGPGGKRLLSTLTAFRGGAPEGPRLYFDQDMSLTKVINYRNGEPEGLALELHPPLDGGSQRVSRLLPLSRGTIQGTVLELDDNGKLLRSAEYVAGRESGMVVEYYPDGSVKSRARVDDYASNQANYAQGQVFQEMPKIQQPELFRSVLEQVGPLVEAAAEITG
ncbi:MAG: hypothetical protein LBP95_08870 [Deltaproteobacteria bacterium]|jgi:DNA-directed RNA polymerase subunit RPC12/RpoP|nr:hypothetical protein [Deltaproteobacteria bacterium]